MGNSFIEVGVGQDYNTFIEGGFERINGVAKSKEG